MVDGTECRPYSSSVCVKGKCVRTGCDGIIGSKLQFDKCGICGGDSTGCIRVVGNFTKKRYEKCEHRALVCLYIPCTYRQESQSGDGRLAHAEFGEMLKVFFFRRCLMGFTV